MGCLATQRDKLEHRPLRVKIKWLCLQGSCRTATPTILFKGLDNEPLASGTVNGTDWPVGSAPAVVFSEEEEE